MATKRPAPLDDPPSASSDEDDETEDEQETIVQKSIHQSSESESEEESDESEEPTPLPVKIPKFSNPNSKSESEDDESEEESESEDETQTQSQAPKSSSIFEFESDIKSASVSNSAIKSKKATISSIPENKPASKRPSVNSDPKNKKVKVSNEDENKSSVIKRVWSEQDEIMLLQGFIDYQSKTLCSPLSDMDGFYQFTMDSIPGNASKSQLYEKVRRLKKKFRVNEAKSTDPVFVKPHERTLFEISKKIWGINGCETVGNVNLSNSKPKSKSRSTKPKPNPNPNSNLKNSKSEIKDEKSAKLADDFETLYPYWNAGLNLGVSSCFCIPTGIVGLFRDDLSLIGEAKAMEMNEKWKTVFENEAVLQKRKEALLSEVSG